MKHKTKAQHCIEVLLVPLRWIFYPFWRIVDYTGPFATFLKALPVAAMFIVIFSPWIIYTWLLNMAQSTKQPLCYLLYIAWLAYFGLSIAGASVVGYLMETKSSSWWGPKSLDYQRQKENKRIWNPDESVKEYLEVLEKTTNDKKRNAHA